MTPPDTFRIEGAQASGTEGQSTDASQAGSFPMPFNPFAHSILFALPEWLSPNPSWHEHLPFALFLMSAHRPQAFVELGAGTGGDAYCAFCQAVKTLGLTTRGCLIDIRQGSEGKSISEVEALAELRAYHDPRYGGFSLLAQSTSVDAALVHVQDNSIDLLHLDGLHTYESVKHAFETWRPKLSARGIVLVHNTNAGERGSGVQQHWAEISRQYPHFEFLHGQGLGVLAVGEVAAPELRALFAANDPTTDRVREFFFRLGRSVSLEGSSAHVGEQLHKLKLQAEQQQQQLTVAQRETARRTQQLVELKAHQPALDIKVAEQERVIASLQAQLQAIASGRGWTLLQLLWRMRRRLAPWGSRRARLLRLPLLAWRVWRREGSQEVGRKTYRKLRGRGGVVADGNVVAPAVEERYQAWIAANEPRAPELEEQRRIAQHFLLRPLISVVTPVYNPPPEILQATIASVLAQTYDHWEMCLADGNSSDPAVRRLLEEMAASDPRIKVRFLEQNQGISGNSNEAFALTTGAYIQLLDHDDLLASNTFFEVVKLLNEKPATDFIYFDEDMVSEDGAVRQRPFFKPDWSPDLLLSCNPMTHSIIRRELVVEVGAFDPKMDGAQDWDLFLRCVERSDRIAHLPKVLYHWRQMQGSTAAQFDAKPYAFAAQLRAIEAHLRRRGLERPKAYFPEPGLLRTTWLAPAPRVSIIIPTKDKVEYLRKCINSITGPTNYPDFEILLIDNGSSEPATHRYYESIASDPRIRIIDYLAKFNYSAANNLGARHAAGEVLLFLNNDTEAVVPDWIEEMVRWAMLPEVGAVGAKLFYPDGTIQHAGLVIGLAGHANHVFWGVRERHFGPFGAVDWYRNYLAVTGACMMMRRAVFDEVGGFDEDYQLAFSDVEICLRAIKKGYRNVYTPFAKLIHYEGRSRGDELPAVDLQRGYDHLKEIIETGDPYFNPNLSHTLRIPTIACTEEISGTARLQLLSKLATQ